MKLKTEVKKNGKQQHTLTLSGRELAILAAMWDIILEENVEEGLCAFGYYGLEISNEGLSKKEALKTSEKLLDLVLDQLSKEVS